MTRSGHPWLALGIAVTAISTAAILVRLAPDVEPIAAAFWRTLIVGALLLPGVHRFHRSGGRWTRADLLRTAVAGLLLSLHFWVWFESISRTTVLRSTLLVCLTPIWAGLLEWKWLDRKPENRFWVGIGITLIGVTLMTGLDRGTSTRLGEFLAVLGGMLAGVYMLMGRVVRQRIDIDAYGSVLCLSSAAWLSIPALVLGTPLIGFERTDWLRLGAMALGPQLLGHMGLNYAVRSLPAAIVSSVVLLEPVGATLLGALVPSIAEIPSPPAIIGGCFALIGVYVATRPRMPIPETDALRSHHRSNDES